VRPIYLKDVIVVDQAGREALDGILGELYLKRNGSTSGYRWLDGFEVWKTIGGKWAWITRILFLLPHKLQKFT
jgi:hypothetical protein